MTVVMGPGCATAKPVTWWERGPVRYGALSYSLWARHIYWDVRGKKPPKKNKAAVKPR